MAECLCLVIATRYNTLRCAEVWPGEASVVNGGWDLRGIYLYLVAFATLMMVVFGLISFLNNVAHFLYPLHYRYYITLMDLEAEFIYSGRDVPSLEVLRQIQTDRMEWMTGTADQSYRLRGIISTMALWLVALPFYLIHWKRIRVELLDAGEVAAGEA